MENNKSKLTKEEQEKSLKKIIHNMECEKMYATEEDICNIKDILSGKKTVVQVLTEEEDKMKKEGLIK